MTTLRTERAIVKQHYMTIRHLIETAADKRARFLKTYGLDEDDDQMTPAFIRALTALREEERILSEMLAELFVDEDTPL